MNLLGEYVDVSVGDHLVNDGDDAALPHGGNGAGRGDGGESAHAWRLEKRRSKYVKARQFLEEKFAETGVECTVRSLEGLTFATWKEFNDVLQEYMKETNQVYISRDSKTTARYNAEQVKRKVKNFVPVPVEFSHARIRFDCKHSHSNMSKNMNLFETKTSGPTSKDTDVHNDDDAAAAAAFLAANPKRKARDGAFYSACPVKMHVQVHKTAATLDVWRVIVTNHVHVHNHDLAQGGGVHGDAAHEMHHRATTVPARLDDAKRKHALASLFSFFTSYQAPRDDDDSFHRRYADMYTYIYQSLCDDKCTESDDAMQAFKKLPKPTTMRKDKRMKGLPPPPLLPVSSSAMIPHGTTTQYHL
ncbi:Aste57867_21330 [Aphanomyces stellatus]|uniref:Aste57867_21330 protein n=1 Tax=Aphanomyces stellatus TaxID=120398 RepID=A0A485LHV5_9STRA|nr:hypothetical protein As57867_021261 [Aphanomyces stellatus]VFT98002.1 Aste57867_21330 [Aphanomyces stellatus]